MPEKNLCSHCEYGNRFTDLGACPECADGRVVGDFHTRGIFCSTGHRITSVAVDFCGKQNCENLTIWQEYTIRLCTLPDGKRLASAAKLLGMTRTQIFRMFKNGTPIEPDPRMGMRFDRMLETAAQLAEQGIPFSVSPCFPDLPELEECFPKYAETYEFLRSCMNHDTFGGDHHEET